MILLNYLIIFLHASIKGGGEAAPLEFNVLYVNLGKESVVEEVRVQGLPDLPVHVYFKALQS